MIKKEYNSDYDMAEGLQKGEMDAFNAIFKKYSSRLYGFTIKHLKSEVETEGLVQNVFLKVWENRKNVKKEHSLKSYLFTIAYHEMVHVFKKKKIFFDISAESAVSIRSDYELEKQIEYKFVLEEVDKLIDLLPDKQKQVFIKSRKEGKSTKEIAEELNISPGTVDNNISAALKFIRKHISSSNPAFFLFFILFFI
ncbi:RNA polymerase sigma factor [Plebeiibacterium sediminum]|uniref:RNA polymerase sigma-70 factor n=1 Tax=Plebeiibacterium sediminum TaxID=2992112 RepID=A0AAE3M5R2_9BACT|nr:RNA polymerase sigma-70 factor [Plebeiobacterium sediminum]MCW3787325.1 RNA polymerase sigma-70 factor [Plebeiobacterium sediminum]